MSSATTTIPAQSGAAFFLKRNELLTIQTPEAAQVCDLLCFNAQDLEETLSCGRTLDYADTIFITKGDVLYSQRSNKMLSIIEDTCGVHDLLLTPCSLKMFQIVAQNEDYHPSCHENLCTNLAHFGIREAQVTNTFNIFMNVPVQTNGRFQIQRPQNKVGDYIVLKAEMDLVVGLTACSHEETNAGMCKPIHFRIDPTPCPLRTALPQSEVV